ncbi:hypothetical protein [Sphingomonas aquatilis]|uniref:EexN family lipoprotein n=1 Tax=Sphingomonas aquatilis TaxID=93063 RepID=A0AAW3TTM3_9SPHN|nr:hypothetical protein [Sphingomonas aquatilis]MBB3874829.1 hypothetical protein [Sphingomonas aquatilis]
MGQLILSYCRTAKCQYDYWQMSLQAERYGTAIRSSTAGNVRLAFALIRKVRQACAMARATSLLLLVPIALVLAGCGRQSDEPQGDANSAEVATPDPAKNTTTEAMCGDPKERADAISRVAEDPKVHDDPDYVYEVASDIAEKGCPKPNR